MGNHHDSIALEWVRGEIQETLKQGQHALEAFVDNRDDTARLRFCLNYLHQVSGTLQMVELLGAALLTEEMEKVAKAMLNDTVVDQDDAIAVLMQAMLQLPQYLEQLHSAQDDFPLVLLPLLNDLRATRSESLLSETSLFNPDLSPARTRAKSGAGQRLQDPKVLGHVEKLRQMFHFAASGITREEDFDAHFEYLDKVVIRLIKLCQQTPMGEIWLAAGALIDTLKARRNPVNAAVKAVINELDLQLKRLIDEHVDVLQQPAPETLLKNILYYVARASDLDTPRVRAVVERYHLAGALPDDQAVDAVRQRVSGPGRDAIHSVVSALNEELARLKDQLDLFVRSEYRRNEELSELLPGLEQIANTLSVLGLAIPRRVILEQVELISTLADTSAPADDGVLMDIAGSLLYVEATLTGLDEQSSARGMAGRESGSEPTDLDRQLSQANTVLLREARNSLEQVKSAIVSFIASQWDAKEIADVPDWLHSIYGGLKLIPLDRAADMLASCEAFVRQALLDGDYVPDWQQLDTLADAVTSIEYYLERLADGITDNDSVLALANESLTLLGFPTGADPTWQRPRQDEAAAAPDITKEVAKESDAELVDDEILAIFIEEAQEVLSTIREFCPRLRRYPDDRDALGEVRRAFHTLKGSGRLVGATSLGDLGWAVEHLLNRILERSVKADASVHQLLDDVQERLPGLVEAFAKGQADYEVADLIERAETLASGQQEAVDPEVAEIPVLTGQEVPTETGEDAGPGVVDDSLVDEEILEIFAEEAQEVLEAISEYLPKLQQSWDDQNALAEIRRGFHTLKGSGRLVGATTIGELAWSVENLLNRIIDQSITMNDDIDQLLPEVVAIIPSLLVDFQQQRPATEDVSLYQSRADALARGETPEAAPLPEPPAADEGLAERSAEKSAAETSPGIDGQHEPDATLDEDVDPVLLDIFRSETETHLETLRDFLAEAQASASNAVPYPDALSRALHTLKGSANTASIGPIAKVIGPFEKYVKTARAENMLSDPRIPELVQRLHDFIAEGLAQLKVSPQLELAGTDAFLEELNQVARETLPQPAGDHDQAARPHPQLVQLFLSDGVERLLDADAMLEEWARKGQPGPRLGDLQDELEKLRDGAVEAGLEDLAELADVLALIYPQARRRATTPSTSFFLSMRAGHDQLIDMMDQAAAGLGTKTDNKLLAQLREIQISLEPKANDGVSQEFNEDLDQIDRGLDEELHLEDVDWAGYETRPPELESDLPEDTEGLDTELVEIFLDEARELIAHTDELLAKWVETPRETPLLQQLQRDLHTLKGGARLADLASIGDLAHHMESLLEGLSEGRLAHATELEDLLLRCHDRLAAMLDSVTHGDKARPAPDLIGEIKQLTGADAHESKALGSPGAESVAAATDSAAPPISPPVSRSESNDDETSSELDAELAEIFLEEAGDIIAASSDLLQQWKEQPDNTDVVRTLQRELHTLKGGARMAQIGPIADVAHEMESLFEVISDSGLAATPEQIETLLRGHDQLAASVEAVAEQGACPPADEVLAELQSVLADIKGGNAAAPTAAEAPSEVDDELTAIFLEEAHELIHSTAGSLQQWVEDPANDALARDLQRDVHTLKGGARMAQIVPIGDLSHVLEDLFEAVEDERIACSPVMADLLFKCHDALAHMVDQLSAGHAPDTPSHLIAQVEALLRAPAGEAAELASASPADSAEDLTVIFLDEARDIESSIADALRSWRDEQDGLLRSVSTLQSELHTLKGGARLAEIDAIAELASAWDTRLQGLLEGRFDSAPTLALSERCLTTLGQLLSTLESGSRPASPHEQLAEFEASGEPHSDPGDEPDSGAIDADVLEIFIDETDELLEALENLMAGWQKEPGRPDFNLEAQRILHTLKGGARLANVTSLAEEAHSFESYLVELQSVGELTKANWDSIGAAHERLTTLVEQLRDPETGEPASAATPPSLEPEPEPEPAEQAPAAEGVDDAPKPKAKAITPQQTPEQKEERRKLARARRKADAARAAQETIRVNAQLVDELVNLAGETSITRSRMEQQISDFSHTLDEMVSTVDRLREQLRRMDIETETQILFSAEKEFGSHYEGEFDPLEMDRYSSIQQLSRALGESASDLADLRETLSEKVRDAETLLLQQSRVNTELQEGLMKTRMIPFASMVPRLRRIVRQISGELDKKVEFDVANAEGELDRTVLERMIAPLEHMLRNAVDHGIESVADRIKAGKPEAGQISLTLTREGGEVVLRMADDGAGIRTDKVREKAIRSGLLNEKEAFADRDILQFILQPGFSTAQAVTQISGRGVGMDVVASEIKQLGGSLDIDSTVGQGTTFTVRLPFTVSVNRALMVSTGEDFYAIPLNTIEGIVRVSTYELEEYYKPDAPLYEYAGQHYRLQYLGSLLHSDHQPKLQGQALPLPVILVRGAEQPIALQVDSLMGSREIVVKSLGPQFGSVRGVSGATILGDGNVVVILDLPAMIRSDVLSARERQLASMAGGSRREANERGTKVMVVDDSVTVRKVTSRLLERNGMEVLLAKDGLDAVAQLQDHLPDIILLDIEMPRMDGFEVASFIRHDERLKDIPIIMITSRTGKKHRERALAIGVNDYLGKPFQEKQLLETINRLNEFAG
ncbi:MAG: hybrid sensor histidine kinase/response regulator [Alteromonadaceae bacterium]|nr:hybrid sensor histidine kinase/response regulator [Alteromonadaceae bacterium]